MDFKREQWLLKLCVYLRMAKIIPRSSFLFSSDIRYFKYMYYLASAKGRFKITKNLQIAPLKPYSFVKKISDHLVPSTVHPITLFFRGPSVFKHTSKRKRISTKNHSFVVFFRERIFFRGFSWKRMLLQNLFFRRKIAKKYSFVVFRKSANRPRKGISAKEKTTKEQGRLYLSKTGLHFTE